MKIDKVILILAIVASFSIGFFAGQSFTPFNRALRKAQDLTRRGISEKKEAIAILTKQKELLDAAFKYAGMEKQRQIIALSLVSVLVKYEMWNEALQYLDIAREITPSDYSVLYNYALIYYNLKNSETDQVKKKEYESKAINYIELAVAKAPHNPEANYLYGALLYEKGDIDKALGIFTEIIKVNPNDVRALFAIARIYYDKKEYEKSKKIYLKLQSILPKDSREMQKVLENLEILTKMKGE